MKPRWSFSKYKTFKNCRERFYWQYIKRERYTENNRKYLEGNVVQKLFEHFINRKKYQTDGKDWLFNNLEDYCKRYLHHPKRPCRLYKNETEAKILRSLNKLVQNAYDLFEAKKFLDSDCQIKSEVEIVQPFTTHSDVIIKIDFLALRDDKLYLFDLKRSRTKYIDASQLLLYNYGVKLKYGKLADKTFFYTLKERKILNVRVTQERVDKLINEIKKIEKIVMSTDYREMTEHKNTCWHCPFREKCKQGQHRGISKGLLSLE